MKTTYTTYKNTYEEKKIKKLYNHTRNKYKKNKINIRHQSYYLDPYIKINKKMFSIIKVTEKNTTRLENLLNN